jgi:hypothetical protein
MSIESFRPLRQFSCALLLLAAAAQLHAETPQASALDFGELERTAVAELKASKTPGAAIAVIRAGEVLWANPAALLRQLPSMRLELTLTSTGAAPIELGRYVLEHSASTPPA